MAATPSLSVFFPADNDAGTIASLVINDGSQNDTPRILDELARVYPGHVRIVHHQQNRGYGGALRSGFATASKDYVFYTDGDAQYDPAEMVLLWQQMTGDVDCDFRLMRRRIFEVVRLEKDSGVICLEMMKKFQDAGFRVAETPVHHFHRTYGKSQFFNFPRIFRTVVDVLKLWWALVIRREHLRTGPPP